MKKIFVIEDNATLRENLVSLLEVEGFSVEWAEIGAMGITGIKSFAPDLILCDIMLPDTDGYSILKKLKSDDNTKNIPFIFLTAKSEMRDLREGMNLGADDYLIKPYDAAELINVINTRIKLSINKPSSVEESKHTYDMEDFIFLETNKSVNKVLIKSIVCIHADAEYSILSLDNKAKLHVRKLMVSWESLLPQRYFIRIHKSIIINLLFIEKIEKWFNSSYKILLNYYPEPIISSRRYSSKIRAKLSK
jgi:DNA-binding response OmpR family regulator